MNDAEYIAISGGDCPFFAITVGSFNLLSGIKLVHRWLFTDSPLNQVLDEIIKIPLSNVHRQSPAAFDGCAISSVEAQLYQLLMINAVFILAPKVQARDIYVSVNLILDTNHIRNSPALNESLFFWAKVLAENVNNVMASNKPFSCLRRLIDRIVEDCTALIHANRNQNATPLFANFNNAYCNEALHNFDLVNVDIRFYALALTSHLQTKMTTIIETPSQQEAVNLFRFLLHFTLPCQRELSSLEVRKRPIVGLFLQCVERQKGNQADFMALSPRPVTWIRLPEKTVQRTAEKCFQEQSLNSLKLMKLIMSSNADESDTKKIINKLKLQIKITECQNVAMLANTAISLLVTSNKTLQNMICEHQLGSLIRNAMVLIAIKNEQFSASGANAGGQKILTKDQINNIQRYLHLSGYDDFLVLVSLAHLFDEEIYKQIKFK